MRTWFIVSVVLAADGPFAWDPKAPSNDSLSPEGLMATELEMQNVAVAGTSHLDLHTVGVWNRITGSYGLH
jgi:hypothetical protein